MDIEIKDIYAGKPDAKDEIDSEGLSSFLENYIMPENFNLTSLVKGNYYFITGYKGTGKTALLYYVDDYIKQQDAQTCSSFVFFKGDYSNLQKQELELLSKRLTSAISIGNDVVLEGQDFEYIWRWLFYQRIIEDNKDYNYGIYRKDDKWDLFEKTINKISAEKKKKLLSIPAKVTLSMPYVDPIQQAKIEPKAELDFSAAKVQESKNYRTFVQIIDLADELFGQLRRTDIPYYIFVDELEAYYGEEKVFKRDLRLIRDLIFTVKKINSVFVKDKKTTTKVICSVRTEIINAINRFIVTKELNKVTSGYEVPLIWDYTNTNSFEHPILKILLKRIEYAEKRNGGLLNEKELIKKWFPEKINGSEPSNYLLNNSWCKPRDMVRLILAAQNCLGSTNSCFSQATIDFCHKKYSTDSLVEIKEEMRALYSPEEITLIIGCLTGFRASFTFAELRKHIDRYYKNSILETRLNAILDDLYRLGIIGNFSPISRSFRWQHKGDDGLVLSDEWQIMIHVALQNALSVNRKHDRASKLKGDNSNLHVGDLVTIKIVNIVPNFAIARIEKFGCNGSIHISQLSKQFNKTVDEVVSVGEIRKARILGYDEVHDKWQLTLKEM